MVKCLVASGHLNRTRPRRKRGAWTLSLTPSGNKSLAAARRPSAAVNDVNGTSLSRADVEDLATTHQLIRDCSDLDR